MKHTLAIVAAALLSVCAGIGPLVTVVLLTRHWAAEAERVDLADHAKTTLVRAIAIFEQAQTTLTLLNTGHWESCSSEHLIRIRQLTIDDRAVEEIGHFGDGRLMCTGWGIVDKFVKEESPDFVLPSGAGLKFDVQPQVTDAGTVLVVSLGRHNALIKPERFVDVLFPGRFTIGIATAGGRIFAQSGFIDREISNDLLSNAQSGGKLLVEVAQGSGLKAFAISDAEEAPGWLAQGRWVLVPVGICVSAVFVGIVVVMSRRRLSVRAEILHALRNHEFLVHYQPIMNISTGQCIGAEALARWRRPNGQFVPPDIFVPYCEQDDLILELTATIIRRVVSDLALLLAKEPGIHVAINVSARDMERGTFLDILSETINEAGLDPSCIWIEATERGFINVEAARITLEKARRAGHSVAIDDFGTGFSSLSMLEGLPLDALKIDKSFVDAIGKQAASSIVTPHIIEMAHGLNLSIVAEGIESLVQEEYLRKAGVQYGQGWLYSKALPPDQFLAFYQARAKIETTYDAGAVQTSRRPLEKEA